MIKKYQLPKEFAEKWVKALRSGKYRQANNTLCDRNDNYCCLGVACKIAGAENKDLLGRDWVPLNSEINVPSGIKGSGANSELAYELSNLNDREGKSFPEIADWICENVEFTESEVTNA